MLTNVSCKQSIPKEKPYKLYDTGGLYLLVNSTNKYFRMDYRYGGKRKTLSFGTYPKVSLKSAREKAQAAHVLLDQGIDPMEQKKRAKATIVENSFEAIATEWFLKNKHTWVETHSNKIIRRLEVNIFPWLGSLPIETITAPMILECLRRIEERGVIETAHRTKQVCGQVFRYAIATGRAERDPCADLKGALSPYKPKHMATIIDPVKIGGLLNAIDDYQGFFITRCALKFAPLVFVRPGELRKAEWKEISFEKAEWKIAAEKMKMRRTHIVPLSKQAIKILEEVFPFSGPDGYVFPGVRTNIRPMSENTITGALRRMGYTKHEMSCHGFRAMASTLLHENGFESHLIETQLAHAEANSVKAAYNHASYLPARVSMMQWWADYLDTLRNSV